MGSKDTKMISLTVKTKNKLGRIWKNVNVVLIHIDDYFYHKPTTFQSTSNEQGVVNFRTIPEGAYLIQTSAKKVYSEQTHKITHDQTLEIKLPSIFGWFHKEMK